MTHFPLYVIEGIILKRKNVGEADRVVTIFSKELGKIYAVAKGVRKIKSRRAPHLEVFTHARVVLHRGKKWDLVTEVQTIQLFYLMRKELPRIAVGYYLVELIDRLLPERQEHRDVFTLLCRTLTQLDSGEIDTKKLYEEFALALLTDLGYLHRERNLDSRDIQRFIESIVERKLRSPRLMDQLA